VGLLLLSMTNRFGQTTARARQVAEQRRKLEGAERQVAEAQIRILHRRVKLQLNAIRLVLISILFSAGMILILFANYLLGASFKNLIIAFFALSLLSLIGSIIYFIRDMSLSLAALEEELRDVIHKG
jgi:hypothetical protein